MSELGNDGGQGNGAAGADAGTGTPGAAELGGGAPAGSAPEWLAALPDDLRGDATLSRYKDIEAVSRGLIETKRLASSRVIVPKADADEATWNGFYQAIGRPDDPAAYEIPVPEGMPTAIADAFRPVAHKLGLTPVQAKGLAEWQNGLVAEGDAADHERGVAELAALKAETPEYDTKVAAAKRLFAAVGGNAEIAQGLDRKLGSGQLVKFMIGLAEKAGEHIRVDGEDPGLQGGGDPDKVMTDKMKDPTWRDRAVTAGTPEHQEYHRLLAAAKAKAQRV